MPLTPEELYLQLGGLLAEMPDLANCPITPEVNRWLGRACALVPKVDPLNASLMRLGPACQGLVGPLRATNAQIIAMIVHQALAMAELDAPARVQGAFIAAGHTLDAYAAIGKVLGTAQSDILMIDPYADEKAVTDYAILAPELVTVRLMADKACYKQTLKPAVERWAQQFGSRRAPLEARLSPAKTLHDRAIIVDQATVWTMGQSFNKLAERSHTSIVRVDGETAALKIAAYMTLWQAAESL